MNKSIGIFVPARLGSQRLPNKQILPIGESCMFDICCKKLDQIKQNYNINTYVLICEDELIQIAKRYPNVIIKERDLGTVKAEGPLQYIYKDILDVNEDYLLFLNPCLTFLSVETIIKSIETFMSSGKEYGTTVKKIQNWIWDKDGNPVTDINYERLTTKEIEPWFQCAHCFHIFNRNRFKEDGLMLTDDLVLLPIPSEETIDIDTKEDYEFAKWKWSEKLNGNIYI